VQTSSATSLAGAQHCLATMGKVHCHCLALPLYTTEVVTVLLLPLRLRARHACQVRPNAVERTRIKLINPTLLIPQNLTQL